MAYSLMITPFDFANHDRIQRSSFLITTRSRARRLRFARLDSRNGHRTGIVSSGEMCYTWVNKLTSGTRRIELHEQSNVFNKK